MNAGRIAILIDGSFFLKRLPKLVTANRCEASEKVVACIRHMCRNHIKILTGSQDSRWQKHICRIFFYDAEPYDGKAHHPIDNRPIDFGKSDVARERRALFEQLRNADLFEHIDGLQSGLKRPGTASTKTNGSGSASED